MRFLLKPKSYGQTKFLYNTRFPAISHSNLIFGDEQSVMGFFRKCYSEDFITSHINGRIKLWHLLAKLEGTHFKDIIKKSCHVYKSIGWESERADSNPNNYIIFVLKEVELEDGGTVHIQEKITWNRFLKLAEQSLTEEELTYKNLL